MVCCKIVTDFDSNKTDFVQFLSSISKKGDFLFVNDSLFFANTEDEDVSINTVYKILKKYKYVNSYVNEYNKDSDLKEADYINSWLYDKLVKISYIQYERASQKSFHDILDGLKILNVEIDNLQSTHISQQKEGE